MKVLFTLSYWREVLADVICIFCIFIWLKSDYCLDLSFTQWSLRDLTDVTLACEDSRNLSMPYQLLTDILLTLQQNKSHVVGAGTKQKPCWILFNLVLSKLIYGFLYVVTRTCQSDYMDLLKLLCGFVQVVLRISWPLSNKTKLMFDQDFKACWSFCQGGSPTRQDRMKDKI